MSKENTPIMIPTTVTNLDITQISEYKQHYFFSPKPEIIFIHVTLALQNSFMFSAFNEGNSTAT